MNDLRQVNRFVQTRHNNIPFKESMSLSDIKGKSLTRTQKIRIWWNCDWFNFRPLNSLYFTKHFCVGFLQQVYKKPGITNNCIVRQAYVTAVVLHMFKKIYLQNISNIILQNVNACEAHKSQVRWMEKNQQDY